MDRISCCVLDKICTLAPLGRYVVFSADELFEALPDDEEATITELKKAVKALTADGYIDLKYQDGEFFCAAPIKKPRPAPPAEPQTATQPPQPTEKTKQAAPVAVLFAAFAGGALGSLIISLIFALV